MAHRLLADTARSAGIAAGRLCRSGAAVLIAGVTRTTLKEAEDRLAGAPLRDQTVVVAVVLGLLVAGAFAAAQFGLIGLLVYWLLVIVAAR